MLLIRSRKQNRNPTFLSSWAVIKPGTVYNEIFAHMDFIPTFCAAGGDPDVVAKWLNGYQVGTKHSRSTSTVTT
jgi:arylsulfatase A-like enzyme